MRGRPNDPNKAKAKARAHAGHTWTCYCGKTVRGNGGKASHQRACEIYQNKPTRVSKEEAEAWLQRCESCQPAIVDALMDASIQQRLSQLKVPNALHIHGGPKSPFISLRFIYPMGNKYTCEAAINHNMNWDTVFAEATTILAARKEQAKLYWGIDEDAEKAVSDQLVSSRDHAARLSGKSFDPEAH